MSTLDAYGQVHLICRDPDRRAAAFAVLARGSVARHPWDWTPESTAAVTPIPGDQPQLRRDPSMTAFTGRLLRRLLRHPEARSRVLSLEQAALPPAAGDWTPRISIILLVPAAPGPDDLTHLDDCAAALQQAPPRTVSGCVIAVEDVLDALAPPPPPVDALHAWSQILSNRPMTRSSEPGQSPAEAAARAWPDLRRQLDQAWGGRLQGICVAMRRRSIAAAIGPVCLSAESMGGSAPFNLPWLLDRATIQPARFGIGAPREILLAEGGLA